MALRDAASVVCWQGEGGRLHVYLLHRRSRLRAFPGVWAFPGGSVEPSDRRTAADRPWMDADRLTAWFGRVEDSPLAVRQTAFMAWAAPRFLRRLGYVPQEVWPAVDRDPAGHQASVVAALRELGEETAWTLDGDAARLGYLGRLVTPPPEPVRFDCRFFALEWRADLDPKLSWPPEEADAGGWEEVDEVLRRAEEDMPLAMPTRYILERLAATPVDELRRFTAPLRRA